MSELDFPTIEAPAAAQASTALTEQPAGTVDLTKIDLQAVALAGFNASRAAVATAKATLTDVVHDLSTPTKLADAKSLRNRLINVPLADARKVSANLKSKLTAVSKAVGAELVAIEEAFDATSQLITPQIEAAQSKLDEERRIAAEKEAARVQAHRDALAKLAAPAERAAGPDMTAERIAKGIDLVEAIVIDRAAWEEFADRAEEQKAVTLERMRALHTKAVAAEEAARLAAEQAAQLKAQQEEAARVAAAQKAEADRLAALAADLARQQAELQAEKDRAAAAAQAVIDEAARVEREAFDAQMKADADARAAAELLARQREEAETLASQQAATTITPDAQESGSMPETSGSCASSEAESAQASPSGSGTAVLADISTVSSVAPSAVVYGYIGRARAEPAPEAPTLMLGELWKRLGLDDREAFLSSLGFPSTPAPKGTGKLYRESDVQAIRRAIATRMTEAADFLEQA